MFPNVEKRREAFEKLDELAKRGEPQEYDRIHLQNAEYSLNVWIRLLFRVYKHGKLYSDELSDMYRIEIDVPTEHDSLEGKFNVKEKREVQLVYYVTPPVDNVAIMSTEHRAATISRTLKALQKYGFTPTESYIELPRGPRAIEVLRELGDIGWVYVGDIPDIHLRGAGLYGTRLQNSEILEDLASRGGRVKAAIIEHPERGVKVILSERGTIYSQEYVDVNTLARIIRGVLTVMSKYGLVRSGKS